MRSITICLPAQLAEFPLDIPLEHPHGGHDNDDGEHADEDSENGEPGAQLVRGEGVHRHAKAFVQFGAVEHESVVPGDSIRCAGRPRAGVVRHARPGATRRALR